MKKCPYCAEEIQEEAIVCRYCGRDLLPVSDKPAVETEKAQVSVWKQGAKASAVITFLYLINIFITPHFGNDLIYRLTLGLVVTFVFWWFISSGIVWAWRRLGFINAIGVFAILGGIIFIVISVSNGRTGFTLLSAAIPTNIPSRTPDPTPTLAPFWLSTPSKPKSACLSWQEVDESFAGKRICVSGVVYDTKITNIGDGQFRIYFSGDLNAFFLLDVNYVYLDVKKGDCVAADGVVETDTRHVPFINLKGKLLGCNLSFGISTPQPTQVQPAINNNQSSCSPAYPGVCIQPPPPDLDCKDIPYKRFKVLPPDPHNFDADGDGIGCES